MNVRTSHLPRLSLYDPAEVSEGSLDPLGLGGVASCLAETLVPGFTERTRRPRILTVLAVGARVLNQYADGTYGDHPEGSASIAFERLVVEAYAWHGARGERGYLGIPGIGKAREAADARVRLERRIYLKSPEAVGLWVAYKGLAVALGILDEDGHLLEPGLELLSEWERGIGEPGLLSSNGSAAEERLRSFDAALAPLLGHAVSDTRRPQSVWRLVVRHLGPHELTLPEAQILRRILCGDSARRAEVFKLVAAAGASLDDTTEEIVGKLPSATSELASVLATIRAYEALASRLTEAWSAIRFVGARHGDGRVDPVRIRKDEDVGGRFGAIPGEVAAVVDDVRPRLDALGLGAPAGRTLDWLDGTATGSPDGLFRALLERHRAVQRDKPPDGKRPWIEGEPGHHFMRTRYFVEEPWPPGTWVHPYRLHSVVSFLQELA